MNADRLIEILRAARDRSETIAQESETAAISATPLRRIGTRPVAQDRREGAVVQAVSDVHFQQGFNALYRVLGELVDAEDSRPVEQVELRAFLELTLQADQLARFDRAGDHCADGAYTHEAFGRIRIRATVGNDTDGIVVAVRLLPSAPPNFDDLYLPAILLDWLSHRTGLILIVGTNGSGKTTALAALILHEIMNRLAGYTRRIYMFEDPIEFVFRDRSITQYEQGRHFKAFPEALRGMRRGNPDIVVIGELGDRENIDVALRLAEQSNLVIGTIHAPSVYRVPERILAEYPPESHPLVRTMLASATIGYMKMALIKTASGHSQRAVCEVMTPTPGMRMQIEKGTGDLRNAMMSAGVSSGNIPFESAAASLVSQGVLTAESVKRCLSNARAAS